MGPHPGDVPVVEIDASGSRRIDPGDDVEQGGLAGAVGSNQARDRTLRDFEVDPVDGPNTAEVLMQVNHADHEGTFPPVHRTFCKRPEN